MASTSKGQFPCPFKDCHASFDTAGQLKKHKTARQDHDFCRKCNADFDDDRALLFHKIHSEKHITCPICSEDFRSEGGQRLHVIQMHSAEQQIICVGCDRIFTRAGGLISHIETNECPKLKGQILAERRAKKEVLTAFLADPVEFRSSVMASGNLKDFGTMKFSDAAIRTGMAELANDGGASLQSPKTNMSKKTRAMSKTSTSKSQATSNPNTPSKTSHGYDDESEGGVLIPEIGEPARETASNASTAGGRRPANTTDLITGIQTMDFSEVNRTWNGFTSRMLFPKARDPDNVAMGQKLDDVPLAGTSKDKENPDSEKGDTVKIDPNDFYNAWLGKYECPHPTCQVTFRGVDAFGQHLKSSVHLPKKIVCPTCLKKFNSITAMVQHCESPSNRCQIRHSEGYNIALDKVTGGLVNVKGYDEHGTPQYEAGQVEW
ncbi:MAG: hypothetical protein M1817_003558 [Caeruleum heppii]|nr:MAG: hypothetical protein M1817_003558 [Caeruleum heppii]